MVSTLSPRFAFISKLALLSMAAASVFLSGCGSGVVVSTATAAVSQIQGSVQGGGSPIAGASVQVYAASTSGQGTSATPMLTSPITSGSTGSFSLPANFKCINASDQIYVVASGGNPGAGNNSNLALMTDLGTCSTITASTSIYINENTTIASVYALQQFMNPNTFDVASSSAQASSVASAYTAAGTLVNFTNGVALTSSPVQAKLDSLSDSLASCINSATNSTPCKSLFADATPSGGAAPLNTIAAILNISLNPTNNVVPIYTLASSTPFVPALSSAPADWRLFGTGSSTTTTTTTLTTPVITWPTPAAITYGAALSAAQLDATSTVPGGFIYSPAIGSTPLAGTDTLSVTFIPTDPTTYSSATSTVSLAVNKATPSIAWSNPAPMASGTALSAAQLDATASVPGTFVYSPAAGATLPAGIQTLSATFTPADAADYTTATKTVSVTVNSGSSTITWPTPAAIMYGTALSAAQLDATSTVPGTFAYSPAIGATLPVGTQTLTATFTPTDTVNYQVQTASVSLMINKATPAVAWANPATITSGTALSAAQLNATAPIPGTFNYSPAAGTVPAVGVDTLSVTFIPTDSTDYNVATKTVSLTVQSTSQTAPTITWATPAAISYGTALSAAQLNATASVPGTFSYSPAAGTTPAAGAQQLSVTFTPTDTTTYSTATASVSLVVNKGTPTITWSTPASVAYGTTLSATQLNASSTVPGTFAYSPAAGTTPSTGNDTLSVTFTPTDTTDYATATKTVSLTVTGGTDTVTWATPAAISYGTALSAAQLNATASVPGTFTYNPAAGTTLPAGTQTLSVTFTPTDTVNYSTQTKTTTLVVNKGTPTVTWSTPAAITYGTALSAAQLNATSTVPGAFNYTPTAGTIPAVGTDTLSVTFTPNDTADYATQTATVNLTVNKSAMTLTWSTPAAITYGTALSSAQLNASSSVAGTFVYSPAAGTTPPAGTQTLSVTFTPTDTVNYSSQTATVNLVVNKATPTVTWASPASIAYGTALSAAQLNATGSVPGTFIYSPPAGSVPPAGTTTIGAVFTPTDSADYTTANKTVMLTVTGGTATVNWPTPAAITYGTALSATQLNATATVPGTFVYSPAAGTTPAAGTDTLSVTFTPTDTVDYSVQTVAVSLVVNKVTPTITWATPAAINYGATLSATQLNATASVPGTFVYSPAAGTTPAAGTDTLSVTFTPTDATDYATQTATVSLVVNKNASTITWATPAAITYGTALTGAQLNATASVPGTFAYSPAAGTVPAAGTDTLSVTFTPTDTTDYATATKTVSLTVNKSAETITWPTPAAITYGTALSAVQLNASASIPGTFAYSPAAGTTPAAGIDTLSVTFTPTDSVDYPTQTATVSLTVNRVTPTITWATPAAITYGTTLSATQLNATASVPGTFVYSPAAGATPSTGTDTLTVTFTPTDSTDYSTQTATVNLVVNAGSETITWATPAAITYGTTLSATQLNATASVPGTFAYSPAAGATPAAGADTLTVTFTPTDSVDYTVKTATVSLTVNKATPTITWATPASIASGTVLSATQLNATASVPGTFAYTPAAGTTPAVGTDTLSVTFTPTDTTDYATATKTVSLTVTNGTTETITWATPAAITYGTALSTTQLNATATVPGTFVYSPAAGTTPTAGTQTLTVTFTPTDTVDYTVKTATVSLTVNKATPTITWATPASITSGTVLSATQLNATASVPGTLVYSPAAGTTPAAGTDTLSVTFTPTDTTDYATATKTVSLTVTGGTTETITWATPAAITYGTALSATQLNATATVPGTFVYSPAAGTTPTAGTKTLSVTFTPTDTTDYTVKTATVSLVVSKVTPTITWATPASITSGTALSATQLNATASVAGTFVYSPAAGTIPVSGNDTLTVTFTPTDTTDYNIVTQSVALTVTGGTAPSSTNIAIGTTAAQTGLKRLGMNTSVQDYYDSGQMMRNLVSRNPGFEGEIWQSILMCSAVTSTSCTDQNEWDQWTANFVQGAHFEFIYGNAKGQTGTISSSTVASTSANQGVTINFPALSPAPAVGDYVIVTMSVPGNGTAGWWTSTSGGGTITTETTDLSPNTPGKQAVTLSATGSGQQATASSYFDSSSISFVQLNGTYTIFFRAKGTGGSNQAAVSLYRYAPTGPETFFNQTITLTNSWQDYSYQFTASENGSSSGAVALNFTASGSSFDLDDVSVGTTPTTANPTAFRDEVVNAFLDLKPGTIRYMDGGPNFGSNLTNMLAVPFARQRAGSSTTSTEQDDIPIGLPDFLQLCQVVGAEPWFNLPPGISTTDMQNLIEYLGGSASTPYGSIRAALGQSAPWTSVFPVIHLELGNEQWNFPTFPGAAINNPIAYGNRITTVYGAARSSASYNPASFDLIMGSFEAVPYWTGQETANASNYDSISVAPYIFDYFNDASSNEAIFGPMFAEPQTVNDVATGTMYQQQQVAAAAGKNLVVYEVNIGAESGTATQAQVNATIPSVGAGLAIADHMLMMMRDLGVKTQQIWALTGYDNAFQNSNGGNETTPLFGTVLDMGGPTNRRRPQFLAEQLANSGIMSTMMATTLSGANPTWNQPLSTNDSVQLSNANYLQTYAFTDGGNNHSVIVFNLSRTSALPITFSGTYTPTGNVTIGQLTSANITDTNENAQVVGITTTSATGFNSATPYSLPPFSMTVFTWQQ